MILGDGQCDVGPTPDLKSGTRPTRTFPLGFDFHAFALCHAGVVVSSIVLPAHRKQHFVTHALWTVVCAEQLVGWLYDSYHVSDLM